MHSSGAAGLFRHATCGQRWAPRSGVSWGAGHPVTGPSEGPKTAERPRASTAKESVSQEALQPSESALQRKQTDLHHSTSARRVW